MKFLDPVNTFINKLDQKTFYIYMIAYSVGCLILCALMVFYYYSAIGLLEKKIKNINAYREEVQEIFEKYAVVKQQQTIVEEMLAKDPNFKIAETFGKFLSELNLAEKEDPRREINTTDLEENYRRIELSSKFNDMTMQELTLLLEKLEQNPRIATNRLEITKSTKKPKTIEVSLTISTLLPKTEGTAT
jgi:hypothetical protein